MKASAEDERAMKEALRKVKHLSEAAELVNDTAAIKGALLLVRGAVLDAYALANAIEDNTRNQARQEAAQREYA